MLLHVSLLFAPAGALMAFNGLLLVAVSRSKAPGLAAWGAGILLAAAGLGLLAVPDAPAWLGGALGCALILLGAGVALAGAALFDGHRQRPGLSVAAPLAWLALCAAAAGSGRAPPPPPLCCLLAAAATGATGRLLWRARAERLPSRRLVVGLLALQTAVDVIAGAVPLLPLPPDPALRADLLVGLLLEVVIYSTGMSFGLVAMAKERAELARVRVLAAACDTAQSASEARLRFIGWLSHEVRNSLHGVLGIAELMVADPLLDAAQHGQAEVMLGTGRHLFALLNDALDLARIDAGELALQIRSVSLADLAADSIGLVRAQAAAKSLHLTADAHIGAPGGLPDTVAGDEVRLRQILLNLLTNAVRYAPPGGRVALAIGPGAAPGLVRFEVSDNGPGVPPHKVAELFARRDRLAGSTAGGGAGIGLSIVAALTQSMHGSTGYARGPGGRGSRFWVELPLYRPPGRVQGAGAAGGARESSSAANSAAATLPAALSISR